MGEIRELEVSVGGKRKRKKEEARGGRWEERTKHIPQAQSKNPGPKREAIKWWHTAGVRGMRGGVSAFWSIRSNSRHRSSSSCRMTSTPCGNVAGIGCVPALELLEAAGSGRRAR